VKSRRRSAFHSVKVTPPIPCLPPRQHHTLIQAGPWLCSRSSPGGGRAMLHYTLRQLVRRRLRVRGSGLVTDGNSCGQLTKLGNHLAVVVVRRSCPRSVLLPAIMTTKIARALYKPGSYMSRRAVRSHVGFGARTHERQHGAHAHRERRSFFSFFSSKNVWL